MKKTVTSLCLILFSLIGLAQKTKKDQYLDNLARKIQFQYKELVFKKGSLEAIKEIVSYINERDYKYFITSSTSKEGNNKENLNLTIGRADMIKRIMQNLGVDISRVKFGGLGEDYPLSAHPSKNDIRVEITVFDKK